MLKFRKRLLVYPQFQLILISVNSILILGSFGLTLWEASRTFKEFQQIGQTIRLPENHAYFKLIDFQASSLYSNMILAFFAAIALSAVVTLVLSHRLAGPIVRLRSYFLDIAKTGKVRGALNFRHGDYFGDLPTAVNGALVSLGTTKDEGTEGSLKDPK
jgi:hypothetical protein